MILTLKELESGLINQLSASGVLALVIIYSLMKTNTFPGAITYLFSLNIILLFANANPFYKYDGYWLVSVLLEKEYLYENAIRELIAVFRNNQSKVNWPLAMYGLGMVIFYIASWLMMIVISYQVSKNFIHDYAVVAPIVLGFLVVMELISKIKRIRTTS